MSEFNVAGVYYKQERYMVDTSNKIDQIQLKVIQQLDIDTIKRRVGR